MRELKTFVAKNLKVNQEQVQVFRLALSTFLSLMYYTSMDAFTGRNLFVEKDSNNKQSEKIIVTQKYI
ncbi:hypothetical protein DD509_00615 [Dehalogenimonas alkenigignens]|uniref:Uncharacterized protein n=1 Tax=Dehalogenimonas alkenigignens TaxID=1217799 RepID=A0A0W0GJJ8_9CHLR|nr:hypothetical protein DEALK_15830 [Dehalogenimonas alkenigignens]PVV84849.1 hypothetical protein DD509_00615 [Dehalogenimonas alkenigignens]